MKLKRNDLIAFLLLILVFFLLIVYVDEKKDEIEGKQLSNILKYYEEHIKNMHYIERITSGIVKMELNEVGNDKVRKRNIMQYMENGMENKIITEFYGQEIEDIKAVFDNKSIKILYYSVDLNEDGLDDMIVYLMSSYHSGALGDSFRILINEGDSYRQLKTTYILRLYSHEENNPITGYVYVLDTTTNGYHDIEITTLDNINFLLKFNEEGYQRIENSSY